LGLTGRSPVSSFYYTTAIVENVNKRFPDVEVLTELELFNPLQGLLWLPKSRSQKNRQEPFSGAMFYQ
jgi:hypothetical protein